MSTMTSCTANTEKPDSPIKQLNLSREELRPFTQRSNLRGWFSVFTVWAYVATCFALAALLPHPLTWILCVLLLGGAQHALAVLEHEGAHNTLFTRRWMNDHIPDWLGARLVWQNLHKYRAHHLKHHARTGAEDDPDRSLHRGFPCDRRSLRRKLLRDISGLTGLKLTFGLILMDAGVLKWTVASEVERLPQEGRRWWHYPVDFFRNAGPMLITNGMLFGVLYALGIGWTYLLWVIAFLTSFPLYVRIRSIAEHSGLPHTTDVMRNTRSTAASWLARLTVAPLDVNFHREHHALASVPHYRLRALHRYLRDIGRIEAAPSYGQVLASVSSGAAGSQRP